MIKESVILEYDIWRRGQASQVESQNSGLSKETRNLSIRQTEKQLQGLKLNNKQTNKQKAHSQCSGFNNKYKGTTTDTCWHVSGSFFKDKSMYPSLESLHSQGWLELLLFLPLPPMAGIVGMYHHAWFYTALGFKLRAWHMVAKHPTKNHCKPRAMLFILFSV